MQQLTNVVSSAVKSPRRARSRNTALLGIAAAAAASLLLAQTSEAANGSDTWQGNTSVSWGTGGNWSPATNAPPITGDSLIFGAAGTSGLTLSDNLMTPGTFNVAGITYNSGAGAFIIAPGTAGTNGFTLTGALTNNSTALETINDLIALPGSQIITTTTGGGNVTLGGIVSGAGTLTAAGTGTLTLTANNTFSGNISVTGGTLIASTTNINSGNPTSGPLGNATVARTISISSGATLNMAVGNILGTGTYNPGNVLMNISGTLTNTSGDTDTLGVVTLTGGTITASKGTANPSFQSYVLSGTVTANGTTQSTISTAGATNAGYHLGAGGAATITFNVDPSATGASLLISAPLIGGSNTAGGAAGSGIIKTGVGTLTLSGANTFSGATTINAGTVSIGSSTGYSSASSSLVFGGTTAAVLDFDGNSATIAGTITANASSVGSIISSVGGSTITLKGNITANSAFTLGNANVIFALSNASTTPYTWTNATATTFTIGGTISRSAGTTLDLVNSSSGGFASSSLTNANGILAPWLFFGTGANTEYATNSSNTIIANTGTAAATEANITDTTGSVDYELAGSGGTIAAGVSANTIRYTGGAGTSTLGGGLSVNGLLNAGTGLWTLSGNTLTIGSTKELVVNAANNAVAISSIIANNAGGASALTKNGGNALTLSGANTYTGGTYIDSGMLIINTGTSNTLAGGAYAGAFTSYPAGGGIPLEVTGTGTLTLSGALSLNGNNNDTNNPAVFMNTAATLNITGTGTLTGISMGWANARSILNLAPAGTLTFSNTTTSLDVGQTGGGAVAANQAAVVTQTTGTVTMNGILALGKWDATYGSYDMSGGILNVAQILSGGNGNNNGNSWFKQTAGTVNVSSFTILNDVNTSNNTGTDVLYISGGNYNQTGTNGLILGDYQGTGIATVAGGNLTLANASIVVGNNASATGILNLNSGTTEANAITHGSGTGIVNFNGGILEASGNSVTAFMTGLTSANIYSGGATINLNGRAITITQNLLAPTGNGLNSAVTISNGGTGYIDSPVVKITDSTGTGATAIANVSGGVLTGITITSPGTGYTNPTFTLVGGGGTGATIAAYTPTADATTGGLTVTGTGTLTLSGANTYTGTTAINGGGVVLDTGAGLTRSYSGSFTSYAAGNGSPIVVNGSGFLTLSGALTLNGDINDSGNFPAIMMGNRGGGNANGVTVSLTGTGTLTNISLGWDDTKNTLDFASTGTITLTASDDALAVGQTGGSGVINQTTGTLTANGIIALGRWDGSYGKYNLSGGTLNAVNIYSGGYGNGAGNSIFYQTGGTVNVSGGTTIGYNFAGSNFLYISAGNYNQTGTTNLVLANGPAGLGVATVAGGNLTLANANIVVGNNATAGTTGILNLNGGVTQTNAVTHGSGTGIVNFNGGTLQASANSATAFMTGLTSANIYSSGATIDTNGRTITIAQSLLAPTGNGFNTAFTISNAGSGYIDAPVVKITDATGTGATAIATVSGGVVTGITITSPGTGYSASPSFALAGGGGTGAVITATPTADAITGGLTVMGSGNLTLSGANTFTGAVQVNSATVSFAADGTGAANPLGAYPGSVTAADLSLNGGGILDTVTTAIGVDRGITLSASGGTLDASTGQTLTINSVIAGNGALTKGVNGGTVVLSSSNTYTGATTVNGGMLSIAADGTGAVNALGAYPGSITPAAITLNGGGILDTTTTTISVNRGITLGAGGGTLDASTGQTLVVNSAITGSGGLTKGANSGTVTLTNANNYSGPTLVTGGTLDLSNQLAAQNSTLTMNGGSLVFDNSVVGNAFTVGGLASLGVGTGYNIALQNNAGSPAAVALTVGGNNASTTYNGVLSGAGSLTKTGSGTLLLSNSNTYAGTTTINGGILRLSSIPAGTVGYYTFSNSGNLGLDSSGNGNNLKTGAGAPTQSTSNLFPGGTAALSLNGSSYLIPSSSIAGLPIGNSAYTIAAWMYVTANGNDGIAGWGNYGTTNQANAFRTAGNTALVNYWWGNDSQTGTLANMQGTWEYVAATYNSTTNTRVIYLNGVAVKTDNPAAGHAATSANFAVGVTNSFTEFFNGMLGNLLITDTSLSSTQINGLMNGSNVNANVLPSTTPLSMAAGTTFDLNGANQTVAELYDANPGSTTGEQVTLGGATLTVGDGTNKTYSGVISGAGASNIVKVGAGSWLLAGANTYAGGTTVGAGTLQVGNATALGASGGAVSVTAGAALDLDGTMMTNTNALTLNGTGISGGGALINSSGTPATYAGLVTLGSSSSIVAGSGNITLSNPGTITGSGFGLTLGGAANGTVASVIGTGTGSVTKTGSGVWTLTGSNTYSGGTAINAGTLQVGSPAALGNSSGAVSVTAGAALDLNGTTITNTNALTLNGTGISGGGALVNSSSTPATYPGLVSLGSSSSIVANGGNITLSNPGTITASGSGFGLTLDGAANGAVAGSIGTGATGTVTKTGAGTWTLAGANTYAGGTTVNAGTLNLTGSLGTGTVAVNGGATLNGTGTIAGSVTVAGGTSSPTQGTIGALNGLASGTLNINTGLTLGGTAGNTSNILSEVGLGTADQINLGSGTLTVNAGGANITVTNLGLVAGNTYPLITFGAGTGAGFATGSGSATIGDLTLNNATSLSFGVSGTLTVTSSAVDLVTSGSTAPLIAYWSGARGVNWTDNTAGFGNFTTDPGGNNFVTAYPAAGTDVVFAATGATNLNTNLGQNFFIKGLSFLATDASANTIGSVSINGNNTLTIEGDGLSNSNTNGVNLAMTTVTPGTSQAWTNTSGAGPLTVAAAVTGNAASGTTTLTINNASSNAVTFAGVIGDGNLGGKLGLTVNSTGSGGVFLSTPNTYSGTTTITAGTLQLGDPNAVQNSTVSIGAVNGLAFNIFIGTFTLGGLSGSGNELLADSFSDPVTIQVGNNNANTTYSGQLSGVGSALTKIGSGTLTLSGSNSYTGATSINSGTLSLSGSLTNSAVTTSGAGILSETSTGAISGTAITFTQSSSGTSILAGSNTYTGATAITAGTLSLSGSLTGSNVTTSGTGVLSETSTGVIAGSGITFTQSSAGTSILGGPNTYTGATSITAGTLSLSGSVTGSNVSTTGTGILSETSTGAIAGTGSTFTQSSSGTSILGGANTYTGATTVSSGTLSLTGSLTGSNVITTGAAVFSETSTGVIAGAATTFTQSSSAASTLAGSNTYGGGTIINSGTLIAGNTTAFGTATGASLTFGAGSTGIVQLNGNSMTIAGLQTNATVGTPIVESGSGTAGADTLTVNIPAATNNTFAGLLTNGGTRTLSLATAGAGTLTLTSANTYTGGTAVNGGTLVVGNAQALGAVSNSLSVGSLGTLSVNAPTNTGLAWVLYAGTANNAGGAQAGNQATFAGSLSGIQGAVSTFTPTSVTNVTSLATLPVATAQYVQAMGSGMINITTGGTYTFTRVGGGVTDDDAAIFVDGTAVVPGVPTTNGSPWTQPTTSGTITLSPGEHSIVVPWYQGFGGEGLQVEWSGADTGNALVNLSTASANITPDLYAANLSGSGNVSLATGNLFVGYDNTSTSFTGAISGVGSVNKWGTGTLTLGGANNYTGTTNVISGTLSLTGSITNSPAINVSSGATLTTNANNPFGSSPTAPWSVAGTLSSTGAGNGVTMPASVALTNGTLSGGATGSSGSFVDSQNTTITATGTSYITSASVGIAASNSLTLNTPTISDSVTVVSALGATSASGGGLIKTGAGTATLYAANTYAGATVISGGTLSLSPLPAGTVGYYNFSNSGNLGLDSSGNGNNLKTGAGSPTWVAGRSGTGGVSLNGASSLVPVSSITGLPVGNSAYTIAGWMNVANNGNDGIVGWGTWGTGNSVNAFRTNGNTELDNYWWANDSITGSLGSMQSTWEYVAATYNPSTNTRVIYLNGVAVQTDNPAAGHNATSANFGVGVTNTTEFFNGTLDNVLITNTALSPAQIAAMMNFTSTNVLPATTTVSMAANTTFNVNGVIQTVAELYDATPGNTTGEQVTLGGGTLTVGDASNTTYSGAISGAGASNLVKVGTGAWTLAGSNTYAGGTTVNNGTLFVSNASGSGTGTGSVAVNTGARLGGTGAIGNGTGTTKFVSINVGGIISPGTDPVLTNVTTPGAMGILTTGDQIWNGGTYAFKTTAESTSATLTNDTQLSNPALNTTQDFLQINGVLDIVQNTKFYLSIEQPVGGPIDNGSQFVVAYANAIDYTDSSGNFLSAVPTGADTSDFVVFDSNNPGDAYNVSIVGDGGGSGYDVVVTVAPEPSSLGLLGLASLGLLRRRRASRVSRSIA